MCPFCEKIKEYQLLLTAFVLGIALIIAVVAGTTNVSQKGIYMTGSAEKIVVSDFATWNITVNSKAPTSAGAYQIIKDQTPVIVKYLTDNGISKDMINIEPSSYWQSFKRYPNGNMSDDVAAYNYSQIIKVSSSDVKLIKKLSTDIQSLTMQGINLMSSTPEYKYSKLAPLKVELLEAASVDAKKRANATLKVNGNKTGKILSVRTGVFQITSPESNDVSDMGINDSSTIDKKITAVVNVTYEIK